MGVLHVKDEDFRVKFLKGGEGYDVDDGSAENRVFRAKTMKDGGNEIIKIY